MKKNTFYYHSPGHYCKHDVCALNGINVMKGNIIILMISFFMSNLPGLRVGAVMGA